MRGQTVMTLFDNNREPDAELRGMVDRYYHLPFNPSLTRVWNWAIAMARTPWVLISNDDVDYTPEWVGAFAHDAHFASAKLHNRFWAFLLHRSLVSDVGWFDERFTTWQWEDTDYVRRMRLKNLLWCAECVVTPHFVSTRTDPVHDTDRGGYIPLDNRAQYVEKWGDANADPDADGVSQWPDVNWYPCSELPDA